MISVTICSPNMTDAAQWRQLIGRASSNVFMNPTALKAAGDTKFAEVQMLQAWDQSSQPARLVGSWAMQVRKVAPFWPRLLEASPYNYAFLSSPIVDPAFATEVIAAFFTAIASSGLPNVINLKDLDAESPSYQAVLTAVAANGGVPLTLSESARPVVSRDFGIKKSGSTRKKLRQDWNRLSALGAVDVVNDRTPEDVALAFEAFLALEADSWKGANGTALLCDAKDAAFVRRLVNGLAGQGDASVALLRVDGRAIAAQVLMYCGATAYTWKTAFSADFAKYSPGALLIDKVTEELFSVPGIDTIDSCSAEGSFMAQLWSGRRRMVDLLVDVGPRKSLGFGLEACRQLGYLRLRDLRNRLRETNWRPKPKKVAVAVPH